MAKVHHLSRQGARRVAIRAQLLQAERPTGLLPLARQLTLLQLDPTSAVAPSADLVAWSRLGSSYSPADLRTALDDRQLIELRAMVRPAEDLVLYRAEMAEWPGRGALKDWHEYRRDWVLANDRCRREILDRLRDAGPLPSRELPDTCEKPWGSTGWTNNRNLTQLLEFMVQRGEVAVAGRKGRDRLWDLASRVYPDDPVVPAEQAEQERDRRRLRALGIARLRGPECPVEPAVVGEAGEPAVVEESGGSSRRSSTSHSTAGRRCCHRSTGSCMTGRVPRSSSSSTTSWRCISPPRSGSGVTSRFRSFTATGWSARSTPRRTGRAACSW
jgi:hypothetical protein